MRSSEIAEMEGLDKKSSAVPPVSINNSGILNGSLAGVFLILFLSHNWKRM